MKSSYRKTPTSILSWILFIVWVSLFLVVSILYGIHYLKEHYQQIDPKLYEIKEKLLLLTPQASDLKILEDTKSYTINKKKVYLCLKDENENYYPMNMLMYVAIHELAHVLCDEIGHTPKFHKIFHQLLDKAHILEIYDPNIPIIHDYCGYNKK